MATQIFIEPELENLVEENASQWFEICSELGLQNQLQHAEKSEDKQAPPYMYIDPKTEIIIRCLCPRLVEVKEYSASTIPLDVLQEIQKCTKHGWYQKIKIAYDDKSPDPFVIGYTHAGHHWNSHKHLIARWGSELLPFEELERKAVARMRDTVIEDLTELKNRVNYGLENTDTFIRGIMGGREIPKSNISLANLTSW